MLVLAIAMALFTPFVFAAPGAVMIAGKVNKRKNGIISAAGPMVNLALSLVFLALIFLELPKLFKSIASYGFIINSWLALFNMLPFWQFDGYKIWKWNKIAYAAIAGIAFIFMLGQNFIKW
jgi:Zn-dependent protease